MHGKELFDFLAKYRSNSISFAKFSCLVQSVLGISEQVTLQRLKDFEVGSFDTLNFEDFNLYCYAILDDLDKGDFGKSTVFVEPPIEAYEDESKKCIIS